LKENDYKEYKECMKKIAAFEEKAFESALDKVKKGA
jgi:hypothetical protein